jgi:hypothetical protein
LFEDTLFWYQYFLVEFFEGIGGVDVQVEVKG